MVKWTLVSPSLAVMVKWTLVSPSLAVMVKWTLVIQPSYWSS